MIGLKILVQRALANKRRPDVSSVNRECVSYPCFPAFPNTRALPYFFDFAYRVHVFSLVRSD